jgi:hypothetical protein
MNETLGPASVRGRLTARAGADSLRPSSPLDSASEDADSTPQVPESPSQARRATRPKLKQKNKNNHKHLPPFPDAAI